MTRWAGLGMPKPEGNFDTYKRLQWPQDKINVPNGYGDMTPITRGNRYIGREYFSVVANFLNFSAGGERSRSIVVPMEAYGDFYLTNIVCAQATPGSNPSTYPNSVPFRVRVTDITSNYDLFTPYVSALSLSCLNNSQLMVSIGQASRSTLPQPYPILRDGAIRVTLDHTASAARDVFITLDGWREYQNAST